MKVLCISRNSSGSNLTVKRGGHRNLGVLGGGVPERAEEHVEASLHNHGRHALRFGSPVPAGRRPLANATFPPPQLLRGRSRGLFISTEIHLKYRHKEAPVLVC